MSVPWPAGSVQNPPTAQQMLAYLSELGTWIDDRRSDLNRLDQKLQETGNTQGVQDIAMTLTVWQAIRDRYADLTRIWDSGRVTTVDLQKLAVMTWASLNDMLTPGTSLTAGGGLALSLPEACRMLDALISQLNSRFQLAPRATETSARITALVAQVDRIRDQAGLDPAAVRQATDPQVADLATDVKDLVDKADRGADIGGVLAPLEVRAARMERDLIVGHAERAMTAQKVARAQAIRSALIAREQAIADLVRKTSESVEPAPKYAVPHVESLGDIPASQPEVDAYLARLDQVSAALDIVQQANEQAYAQVTSLLTRLEKAEAVHPASKDPLGSALSWQIRELLGRHPVPLAVIDPLITAYEASGRQS
ncbi:MAG: hypothetical protein FWF25_00975 [Propionibacteriaceae bacterium]|nr:hypothetical protein [Propionibacteriaceae bacterium]